MAQDIPENNRHRFVPYLQLHEFEALLFSDPTVFSKLYSPEEFQDLDYLNQTIRDFPNPEDINDQPETTPSQRIKRIIGRYNKPTVGALLSGELGLETIRAKCPRFNEWIDRVLGAIN